MWVFAVDRLMCSPGADLGVGEAARHGRQDLLLAVGECRQGGAGQRGGLGREAKSSINRRVTLGASSPSPPAMTRTAASGSSSGIAALRRKPLAPTLQRLVDVLIVVEGGQDQDACGVGLGVADDVARGLEAVHLRHPDVHEHHVRLQLLRQGNGLGSVACLAHNRHVIGGLDPAKRGRFEARPRRQPPEP